MNNTTIAVIGCGAAAVSFIKSFIRQCNINQLKNLNIIIFESTSVLGVGLAYQEDLTSLLINRPAQYMSANYREPDEFYHWLKKSNLSVIEIDKISENVPIYPPRQCFGYYLRDLLRESICQANNSCIKIKIIKDSVTKLTGTNEIHIQTSKSGIFVANYALLATGNNQPKDFYNLKDTPKYIHSPYPLYNSLSFVGSSENVGIIGNSLTAIDIALSLNYLKHHSNITMLSRLNVMPRVKSNIINPYNLEFLTTSAITKKIEKKHKITLRDVLRFFRKELKLNNLSWKQFFVEDNKSIGFAELIRQELSSTQYQKKWQEIINSTNEVVEDIWHLLEPKCKEIFLKNYQRIWLSRRTSIPPKNANALLKLSEQQKLFSVSGLEEIRYEHKIQKYIAVTKKNKFVFDWIVNATGPNRYIQPDDGLMHALIKIGIARSHPFGGIDVDFDTSAVINREGQVNINIRALGHNTIGVYNYTSSLEMIARKADKIALDLVIQIKRKNINDQDKNSNDPAFSCPSHIA